MFPTYRQWKKWSLPSKYTALGFLVGVLALLFSLVFFLCSVLRDSGASGGHQSGISETVTDTQEETELLVIELLDKTSQHRPDLEKLLPWLRDREALLTQRLEEDPYDLEALILRGIQYLSIQQLVGGYAYRKAHSDFSRVSAIDSQWSDPHFGLGYICFHLALYDLIDRGRYHVSAPGSITERIWPEYELFPDRRTMLLLKKALVEYQAGKSKKQMFSEGEETVTLLFSPFKIDQYIGTIRSMLGLEPRRSPDPVVVDVLMTVMLDKPIEGLKFWGISPPAGSKRAEENER